MIESTIARTFWFDQSRGFARIIFHILVLVAHLLNLTCKHFTLLRMNLKVLSLLGSDYNIKRGYFFNLLEQDSQNLQVDYPSVDANDNVGQLTLRSSNIKAPEDDHKEKIQPATDKQDMSRNTNQVIEAEGLNEDALKDKQEEENFEKENQKRRTREKAKEISTSTPPKKKSRSSDDSGTESGSSRRSLRRSPRRGANNKKTKSPLPVEIIKVKHLYLLRPNPSFARNFFQSQNIQYHTSI